MRLSKIARRQWEYFIDCISQNGYLNTPLGDWVRHRDQSFKYLYYKETNMVYKLNDSRWNVFGRKRKTSRRFRKIQLVVGKPSKESFPI